MRYLCSVELYYCYMLTVVVIVRLILIVVNNCRVPKPDAINYRYTEVVRKQDLRRKMDGFACFQCQQVSV